MRGVWVVLLAVVAGCGTPQRSATAATPTWPNLCVQTPRSHAHHHFGTEVEEDPDCWRAHWPVRACESPAHPEVIGLWGLADGSFDGRLLYDGCCVTFYDTGSLRMTPTVAMMAEALTLGRPANVGAANRTHAVWDGDTLFSDSHLGLLPVARREVGEDGTARLLFVDADHREQRVVRFQREHCVDEATRDVLCARAIVPGARHTQSEACAR